MGLGSAIGGAIGAIGSIIGGNQSSKNQQALANMNYAAQKEFAQNGIRWRVEDAKAAGIHPLYALGASTASYSPVSGYSGDNGISDAFSQFGQGISRAAEAKMTREEREKEDARQEMRDVFELARFNADMRKQDAEIRLIDSEIARNHAASNAAVSSVARPPAMPNSSSSTVVPGQGDAPVRNPSTVDNGGSMYQFMRQPNGTYALMPGSDWSQAYEDKGMFLEQWPIVKTMVYDYAKRASGGIIDGMVYSNSLDGWVPVSSPAGKSALADPYGIRGVSNGLKFILNPRGKKTKDDFSRDYRKSFYVD